MEDIKILLLDYKIPEVRSALYYLTRYIKQADIFENYEKDIFDESEESKPSEVVIHLTLKLIDVVEKIAQKKAMYFNEDEFYFWMDTISEIENKIDPELSEVNIKKALDQISEFKEPTK